MTIFTFHATICQYSYFEARSEKLISEKKDISEQNNTSDEKKQQDEENKQQDEFIREVNESLEPFMKKLGLSHYGNVVCQSVQTISAPFMGQSLWGLGIFLGALTVGNHVRENNQIEDNNVKREAHIESINSWVQKFFDLPEVERDSFCNPSYKERIDTMTRTIIAYMEAKVRYKASILMAGLSLLTTPFMSPWVIVALPFLAAANYGVARWIGKQEREKVRPLKAQATEAANQTNERQSAALKNTVANQATGNIDSVMDEVHNARNREHGLNKKLQAVLKKSLNKITIINSLLTVGMIGIAWLSGLDIGSMAATFAGTIMLSQGASFATRAFYTFTKLEDELNDQYKKIKHKEVYNLKYGQKKPMITQTVSFFQIYVIIIGIAMMCQKNKEND